MSEQGRSVLFTNCIYIVWGSLTLANIGCTNQEWNEQHTARNVLSLHFAKKNIFSSMNMNYKHNHKIIQTPLTPLVAFGWRPNSLKPHPAWKEGEVPFCIILCCCRQKILSRGTYSEDLELSFLEQTSRKAYKYYSIFRNTPVLIQDLVHIRLKRLFTSCNQTTHPESKKY